MYYRLVFAILASVLPILFVEVSKGKRLEKAVYAAVSVIYTAAVIVLVAISGGRIGLSGTDFTLPLPCWVAIRDLHYGFTANRSVMNVLLFVPFGYLLPEFLRRKGKPKIRWWWVTLSGLGLTLLIETSQLVFHFGVFEFDDLVKNTMGAAVGYAVWRGLERLRKKPDKKPTVKNKERNNADD